MRMKRKARSCRCWRGGCLRGFHVGCLQPALDAVPRAYRDQLNIPCYVPVELPRLVTHLLTRFSDKRFLVSSSK